MAANLDMANKRKAELEKAGLPTEVVGQNNIRKEDLLIPRVKLCQGTTKEVKEGRARVGEFIDSISGDSYGTKIEIIPCAYYFQMIKFTPSLSVDCVAINSAVGSRYGNCNACNFREFTSPNGAKKEKGPECNIAHTFLAIIASGFGEEKGKILNVGSLISFSRTSLSVGKKILSTYKFSKTRMNYWERVWTISSKDRGEGAKQSLMLAATPGRILDPANEMDLAAMKLGKELYDWSTKKGRLVVETAHDNKDEFEPGEIEDSEPTPL